MYVKRWKGSKDINRTTNRVAAGEKYEGENSKAYSFVTVTKNGKTVLQQ